jgi:hypothetical protein
MSLGLADRKSTLEKSGLCMFCLKHAADLECYGKGGLSKPRCTLPGCDGEHTPDVHVLMGEESAGVNITTGDGGKEEDEDEGGGEHEAEEEGEYEAEEEGEYEDEGWWVGTVGVMEVPEWAGESPHGMLCAGQAQGIHHSDADTSSPPKEGPEGLLSDCPPDEMTGDECWNLESTHTSLKGDEEAARPFRAPQQPADGAGRSSCLGGTKRRKLRKRPGMTRDQDWEEARRNAWLRQMLSDTSSDEDESEVHHGRFAESGRWVAELHKIPQHSAPTSGGECSG